MLGLMDRQDVMKRGINGMKNDLVVSVKVSRVADEASGKCKRLEERQSELDKIRKEIKKMDIKLATAILGLLSLVAMIILI
jgi:hypothetical protein